MDSYVIQYIAGQRNVREGQYNYTQMIHGCFVYNLTYAVNIQKNVTEKLC